MTKKLIIFIIFAAIVLASCEPKGDFVKITVVAPDDFTIFYGAADYAYFGGNEQSLAETAKEVNKLVLQTTDRELDPLTAYTLKFYRMGWEIITIRFDESGTFCINDDPVCYTDAAGEFNAYLIEAVFVYKLGEIALF